MRNAWNSGIVIWVTILPCRDAIVRPASRRSHRRELRSTFHRLSTTRARVRFTRGMSASPAPVPVPDNSTDKQDHEEGQESHVSFS